MKEPEFTAQIVEFGGSELLARTYVGIAEIYKIPLDEMSTILYPLLSCTDAGKMRQLSTLADQVYQENYGSIINPRTEEEV